MIRKKHNCIAHAVKQSQVKNHTTEIYAFFSLNYWNIPLGFFSTYFTILMTLSTSGQLKYFDDTVLFD